ncbi:thiamine pyrophosphokinase [Xylariaceae sp. FL1651]|nr:thiamine pyrophosphokinase [Xylariaceae sp. FL1651]
MVTITEPDFIEWHPARQLLGYPKNGFILIILNQPIRNPALFEDLWSIADARIAADGGANRICDVHRQTLSEGGSSARGLSDQFTNLDTIIGDLDSLSDEARRYFSRSRIIHDPDQYSSDFTKAVWHARREYPGRDLVCMGGLGGRVDQGLSQLHHLYMFQTSPTYAEGRMYLLSGESLSFVLKGGRGHQIRVREPNLTVKESFKRDSSEPFAKYVGIIPVGEPAVISTKGLEWDVQDWPTVFGGQMSTSNHVLPETQVVEIQADKDVLFTIALK